MGHASVEIRVSVAIREANRRTICWEPAIRQSAPSHVFAIKSPHDALGKATDTIVAIARGRSSWHGNHWDSIREKNETTPIFQTPFLVGCDIPYSSHNDKSTNRRKP
jgi:hypothetical protein